MPFEIPRFIIALAVLAFNELLLFFWCLVDLTGGLYTGQKLKVEGVFHMWNEDCLEAVFASLSISLMYIWPMGYQHKPFDPSF